MRVLVCLNELNGTKKSRGTTGSITISALGSTNLLRSTIKRWARAREKACMM